MRACVCVCVRACVCMYISIYMCTYILPRQEKTTLNAGIFSDVGLSGVFKTLRDCSIQQPLRVQTDPSGPGPFLRAHHYNIDNNDMKVLIL